MRVLDLSIPALAAALRSRNVSAVEVATAAIERHELLAERLKAYKLFDAEGALERARAADRALAGAGADAPPLTGIPMSVKDLYGVAGMPTYAGSPRPLAERWSRDAWLVSRLKEAGAVTMGKTHMVEFAFGGVGLNPHWATPWNPWDEEVHRIPGGSSSGAGVSLAEGSALIALGSDTGGSIRIPAALTGTVGQRTTLGRWPTAGVVPLSPTFDTVGALTRTVEDTIWFFGAVDPAWGDSAALFRELERTRLSGLRIGVPVCGIAHDCQPDIGDVITNTLADLGAAGASLVELDGHLLDDAWDVAMGGATIASTELRTFMERELPEWLQLLDPIVSNRVGRAVPITDPKHDASLARVKQLQGMAPTLFEQADVLLLPANLLTAPPVSEVDDPDELTRYEQVNRTILRPTYPVGVLGLTAISIPVGRDEAGMPVGLQLVAPGGRDEALLGAALAVERALGTAEQLLGRPPAVQRTEA